MLFSSYLIKNLKPSMLEFVFHDVEGYMVYKVISDDEILNDARIYYKKKFWILFNEDVYIKRSGVLIKIDPDQWKVLINLVKTHEELLKDRQIKKEHDMQWVNDNE